ncbi:MAG: hypothetical protein HY859_07020 [Caulobacterales bacterium]|nr:hypothetical protein [Caulobacterales bacterium]
MKSLKVFATTLLAAAGVSVAPVTPEGGVPQARAQTMMCVSHRQQNNSIYIHNGCGVTIYWMACVTPLGTTRVSGYSGGLTEGDYDFTPGPFAFSYTLLSSPTAMPSCFG